MRRRGSFLVEAIVSMLIFTVGLLALALSLTFGARIIIDAGQNTIKEQKLANLPEEYLMDRNNENRCDFESFWNTNQPDKSKNRT